MQDDRDEMSLADSQETLAAMQEGFAVVERALAEQEARRRARIAVADEMPARAFAEELDRLRVRMADDRRLPPEERGGAHRVLTDAELGILHFQMERYERAGRLVILDRIHADQPDPYHDLRSLRMNLLAGKDIVSGERFRRITRNIARRFMLEFRDDALIPPSMKPFGFVGEHTVVALPWRASLVAGEVFHERGVRGFLHLGIRRNERTADPETYFEEYAGQEPTAAVSGLVVEPMCATGQTPAVAVERLMERVEIPQERIVVFTYVAAPEGVDFLLRTYPHIRIVTVALDEMLNAAAYIVCGLGDFGDLVMRGVDDAYAEERWITPGYLTRAQVDRIFTRTREVAAAHAHAAATSLAV